MAEDRKPLLIAGLALAGFAGYKLLQKPAPAPAPPPVVPPPFPVPPPSPGGYVVTATLGLIVRAGPGQSYPRVGSLGYQARVLIACQAFGQQVGNSRIWDQITGPVAGWVSDWWISTPGVGVFSPGIPQCAIQPPPTPGPTGLPPTGSPGGLPPISDRRAVQQGMAIATGCAWGIPDYLMLPDTFGINYPNSGQLVRAWIKDDDTFRRLGFPRSAVRIVTADVLNSFRNGGTIRTQYGRSSTGQVWSLSWDTNPPWPIWINPPAVPPPLIKSPAGYCQ